MSRTHKGSKGPGWEPWSNATEKQQQQAEWEDDVADTVVPNGKVWSFDEQLKKGRKGERLLLKHWPHPVRKHAELKGPDFVDSTGRIIELKSDSYELAKTPNFFIERWSREGVAGGPWQALEKGVTCFVYLFPDAKTWFIFEDLRLLVRTLDKLTEGCYLHNVRNVAWTTQGYKVERALLKHLYRMEVLKSERRS